ncbi:casein alpha s1 [Rhinolophus ferrumequinum]|uniref:Alpha-S1-casein n=1 Tax=Rhinolophus ferrumequinum TaxID=59479 RepID=A0A7J7ZBF4_RHIFE|nr:casein alpha s1 [Rhinolophus ferrumequinum]
MKLFIFTCLVAVALAKPNLPLRHSELIQNEQDSVEPFQQRGAYPYAAWYYPSQIMQYIPYSPFYDINKPIASENDEKTDIMPEWW